MTNRLIDDITRFIFVSEEPRPSDVIFLPGGSDPAPPERAAELYRAGYAPRLLPAGGVSAKTGRFNGVKRKTEVYTGAYPTDCAFYTDVLIKNGVPAPAILAENRSGYTKQNAAFSREVTDRLGLTIRTALIVCKSFHARRSLICYQLAFPEAVIRVVPVDVYGITRENWHCTEDGVRRVTGELMRCGSQFEQELYEYAYSYGKDRTP